VESRRVPRDSTPGRADYPGHVVADFDKEGLFGDERLGRASSGVGGAFLTNYSPGTYGLEASLDIYVRVFDRS
jgi:hypothetical protein